MGTVIDYRAWDKVEKVMYYHIQDLYDWSYVTDIDKNHSAWESGGRIGGTCFGELIQNKNLIFMQYTGYDDFFGKRVYDSDICKYYIDGEWRIGAIRWANGSFLFVDFTTNSVDSFYYFVPAQSESNVLTHKFEVVGNIYEEKRV
jgi:hypothetical protein